MDMPVNQASIGAICAWRNAGSLLDAAALAMRCGFAGPAVSLCVLSFEESSKAIALLHRSSGANNIEFLRSIFTHHGTKQALGIYASSSLNSAFSKQGGRFVGPDDAFTPEFVDASLKELEGKAESLKQRGFYVDFQQGTWRTPDQLTQADYNLAVLGAVVNLFVAKTLLPAEVLNPNPALAKY